MCENYCKNLESSSFQEEFSKFIKGKPKMDPKKLFDGLPMSDSEKCSFKFDGYGINQENEKDPMFRTSNSEYGFFPPNQFTIPSRHFPLSQRFTNEANRFGMYRNFSLNTQRDRIYF